MNKVPQSLKNLRQWINWELQKQEKGPDKKMPVQTDGSPAKSNDPTTWTDFNTAVDAKLNFTGIGFVFSAEDPYCGIDFDGCRDPKSGDVSEWAKVWIKRFDSYAEVSPSMTGVKIWIIGKLPFDTGKKVPVKEPPMGGKEPAVEAYDHGRYFAVTGLKLAGIPVEVQSRQEVLEAFCKEFFTETEAKRVDRESSRISVIERASRYLDRVPGAISGSGGHNQTFKTACILILGFSLTPTEALVLMVQWNQRCEPKWSERELRHKVDSADKQSGERGFLRDAREDQWGSTEVPDYKEPERQNTPSSSEGKKKETLESTLKIVTLEKATEQYLTRVKDGLPSLITLGIPRLDEAVGGGVAYGEKIFIAARPGHGKSMFGMQILDSASKHGIPTAIISEEMSSAALAERAILFSTETQKEQWQEQRDQVAKDMADHFAGRANTYIVEGCGTSLRACDTIRMLALEKGVKIVAVDYVQMLSSPGKSRYEQVTNTSIILSKVTQETGIMLLLMCQLSRSIEHREKFIPRLEDLKESGQLDQDADVVLFLVWPYKLDPEHPKNVYQIWIGKNKMRETKWHMVNCEFQPDRQRIVMPEYMPFGQETKIYCGNFSRRKGNFNAVERE